MRYLNASLAFAVVAILAAYPFIAERHAPSPETLHSLHAFDLRGDGYPVTLFTNLSEATCNELKATGNNTSDPYLYVCRVSGN